MRLLVAAYVLLLAVLCVLAAEAARRLLASRRGRPLCALEKRGAFLASVRARIFRGEVRRVLESAADVPDPALTYYLAKYVFSNDLALADRAFLAIGRHPDLYGGATDAVVGAVAEGKKGRVVSEAWALGRLAVTYPGAIPKLAASGSPSVRLAAVRAAMRRCLGPRVSAHEIQLRVQLLRDATRDPDEGVRAAACRGLRCVPGADSTAWLVAALADASCAVRQESIRALGTVGGSPAAAALAHELEDETGELFPAALEALARFPDPPTEGWLSAGYQGPTSARVAALRALGTQAKAELADAILPLLDDEEKAVRRQTALTIAGIARAVSPARLKPLLVESLLRRFDEETSQSTREAIAFALAFTSSPAALQGVRHRIAGAGSFVGEKLSQAAEILETSLSVGIRR